MQCTDNNVLSDRLIPSTNLHPGLYHTLLSLLEEAVFIEACDHDLNATYIGEVR